MEQVILNQDDYKKLIKAIEDLKEKVADLSDKKKKLAKEYVDSWEAARILKISRRTLERYRDANKIPCYKLNRKVYYRVTDLEYYIFHMNGTFKLN
jgi:hypothetical protein